MRIVGTRFGTAFDKSGPSWVGTSDRQLYGGEGTERSDP
jgi:hypothetical protein